MFKTTYPHPEGGNFDVDFLYSLSFNFQTKENRTSFYGKYFYFFQCPAKVIGFGSLFIAAFSARARTGNFFHCLLLSKKKKKMWNRGRIKYRIFV
jgi:hypothetical protein